LLVRNTIHDYDGCPRREIIYFGDKLVKMIYFASVRYLWEEYLNSNTYEPKRITKDKVHNKIKFKLNALQGRVDRSLGLIHVYTHNSRDSLELNH
jgi:hypothetical protein